MNPLFDPAPLNSGRQLELDLARGLAVLFMIAVHVQEMFATPQVAESWLGWVVEFFGGPPAAPVFMFLLGAGIVYSKKSTAAVLIRRGGLIFIAGYILNLIRSTLPALVSGVIEADDEYFAEALTGLAEVDILQFAGLALFFFGVIRGLRGGGKTLLVLGILFAGGNLLIGRHPVAGLLPAAITGLFWGSGELSYFPFLTWIPYPIAGYLFATLLIRCRDKNLFYGLLLAGSVIVLTNALIALPFVGGSLAGDAEYDYYHHHAMLNAVFILFVLAWLALLHFATRALPRVPFTTLRRWSANVAAIYFIHWCLLGWLAVIIGYNTIGYAISFLIFLITCICSDLLACGYARLCQFSSNRQARSGG